MAGRARARPRVGLQAEVLVSFTLVMVVAAGVLAAVWVRIHEGHIAQLRPLAARSLLADANAPLSRAELPGIQWWTVQGDDTVIPRGAASAPIEAGALALARAAREGGKPLLQAGRAWQPIRFAAPVDAHVVVAWLPPAAPGPLVALLVLGALAIFTAFGGVLLRGRLVVPLRRLVEGVRAVADGTLDARVPVEGVAETAEVATAFNEMAEALAGRTTALEKAVRELRESNESLRTAREGLDRAERLAATGRLAAGVAHEVGNPMGAVLAFLDLVGRDPGLTAPGHEYLAKAAREGERVRVILRGLLDFSRPQHGVPVALDLPRVCEETVDLVRAQRRYGGIAFSVRVEGPPPPALADRSAVAQIVLNLVLNAADALRSGEGAGRVEVTVRPAPRRTRVGDDPEAAAARRRFDAVDVVVADDGPGIAAEDRERIFDPFFTTKPPGDGTGLGLSNALRLAEQLQGTVLLGPEQGAGATFVLRLPAAGSGTTGVRGRDRSS